MLTELRTNPNLKIDARSADDAEYLDGYAALFNARTVIWDFEELIAPGAFARALSENQDVRTLFNHDPNYPLARTKNGTLVMRETKEGLWTESKLSKNPTSDSIADYVRTGLVSGMSFAFTVRKQEWIFQEIGSEELDQRVITEIGVLYDVGPVTYPAYEQTSIKMRAEAKKLHDEARSRWESRRSSFQVPAGFELVCREARGIGAEDAWEADKTDPEVRQVLRASDPGDEHKEAEDEQVKAPVEGSGEEAPKPEGEGEGQVEGGDGASGADKAEPQELVEDPIVEASSRESWLNKLRAKASPGTRVAAQRK